MKLRTRFAFTTALVGATVAFAAAVGGQLVVAHQLRSEIDRALSRRSVPEGPNGPGQPGGPDGRRAGGRNLATATLSTETTIGSFGADGVSDATGGTGGGADDGGAGDLGTGRGRRRGTEAIRVGPNGRELTPAELQTLSLNRRCLNGRRGDAVILVQLIAVDGTVETCLSGQQFPVDSQDKALAKTSAGLGRSNLRLRTVTVAGDRFRMATISGPFGATQWVHELAGESAVLRRLRWQFLLLGVGATLLAALAGWLLGARFLRPIHKLRSATDRIAETQNLSEPVDASGQDEIGSLGRSFNAMISALATSREQQQRLILDASHELRTPLTSLRTNIEIANRPRRLNDDDNREVMGAALSEVEELTNVINELVELATDRTADEAVVPVHLLDLANDVAERARRRTDRVILVTPHPAPGAQVADQTQGAGQAGEIGAESVLGRPRMLERAIANLVENAVKYSTPGTPITIDTSRCSVTVVDQGPGIHEQDLPYIFDRFYRSPEARAAQGSGLGLAIVRQIVDRHGGAVVARNNANGGAAVGFALPESPDPGQILKSPEMPAISG
jgi:two-component system, OmpR family, sensor histidine kinase MprB